MIESIYEALFLDYFKIDIQNIFADINAMDVGSDMDIENTEVAMTDKEKREQIDDKYKEQKIQKATARVHKASWSDILILSLLLSAVLFAIYMIEKY